MNTSEIRQIIFRGLANGSGMLSEPWDDAMPDVDDERVLQMGIALELHRHFPSMVRVELLVGRLSPRWLPQQASKLAKTLANIGTPIPKEERQGKIDVVLYRDDHRIVPRVLVEVKRGYAPQSKITEDLLRCKLILECFDSKYHSDLVAYCAFPVLLDAEAEHDQAVAQQQLLNTTSWAVNLAAQLSGSVQVSTHFCWNSALRQRAVEGDPHYPETLEWNSKGFVLVPFLFELAK